MPTVHIHGKPFFAPVGMSLSDLFAHIGIPVEHPCGGRGTCRKCTVLVNGTPERSCQYRIRGDISVETEAPLPISVSIDTAPDALPPPAFTALVLDIGTTTMTLALTDTRTGKLLFADSANNPQRAFGADIMSRISYAAGGGLSDLTRVLRAEIRRLVNGLADRFSLSPCPLYVTGNTTMLHLLLGVDPSPMGTAPYTPVFLEEKHLSPEACGLDGCGLTTVITLPGCSAFVGADLTAGLHQVLHGIYACDGSEVALPAKDSRLLLVDLGTNAEILLYDRGRILCTAAAAGPCLEGASISSGMSATAGAICRIESDGTCTTIEDAPPVGLCGTGLVDAVALLLDRGVVDETGYMAIDECHLCDGVSLVREDIRQYQLAKSAIHAAIDALIRHAGLTYADIRFLFIAGGLACVDARNAVRTGLLPRELADRCIPAGDTALFGTARYAHDGFDLTAYTSHATYIDLARDPYFSERFMEGMFFEEP